MIVLNLKTETEEQEIIKNYLEQNVSEVLAKKINNGVFITKDGKQLLNKKDLAGFWQFASKEAQKLAKQGARVKAVKDDKVFGWAIHYFEEDSIEGRLYNPDGTEYKPKITTPKYVQKPEIEPVKEQNKQGSLFDILNPNTEEKTQNEVENEDEMQKNTEIIENNCEKPISQKIYEPDPLFDEDVYTIDKITGEVIQKEVIKIDKENEFVKVLKSLLDNKLILL